MIRLRVLAALTVLVGAATPAMCQTVSFNTPTVKLYDADCFESTSVVPKGQLSSLVIDETADKKGGCLVLKDQNGKRYYVLKISTTLADCSLNNMRSPDRATGAFKAGSRGAAC